MNIFLALIQLLTIILINVYEYKKKYTSIFLWGTLLVMFGIPHFLSIAINNTLYDDITMIKASVFVILFNLLYIGTKMFINFMPIKSSEDKQKNVEGNELYNTNKLGITERNIYISKLFLVILIISLIILIIFNIKYLGDIRESSWGKLYDLNVELGFRSPLRYGKILFFASAGVALVYRKLDKKVLYITSLSIVIFYALLTGNRITILPALTTIIIPYIFNEHKRLKIRHIIFFVFMGFFSVYTVYFLRFLRIYGGLYNFINEFNFQEINTKLLDMMLSGDGELGLRNTFYYFIYHNNNFINFNKGHTYIRLLLIAIPTKLIPKIKPPDFAISMGTAWSRNPYNTKFSMHPTLYGDCFANLWWYGIFLGVFWALFTHFLEKYISRRNTVLRDILRVLFSCVYVIVGRGSVYNGFFIGYAASIIIGFTYFMSRFKLTLK